ncbi:MAG: hypothetical protein ABIR83_08910 [Nakamurella sp.]
MTGQLREEAASGRRVVLRRGVLDGLVLVTGVAGLAGGLLLVLAPDGSVLRADPALAIDEKGQQTR